MSSEFVLKVRSIQKADFLAQKILSLKNDKILPQFKLLSTYRALLLDIINF